MTGVIALQGGGPFTANDDLDARLLAEVGAIGADGADGAGRRVVVLPTADAFEHPERLVTAAIGWAERLGVEVEALMVLRRGEAMDDGAAEVVRAARAVYLVGDQPLHLRSVLKDTPLWHAIVDVLAAGGLVVGVGACASALCDPMVDPRGGAFTLGLGMVTGLGVVTPSRAGRPNGCSAPCAWPTPPSPACRRAAPSCVGTRRGRRWATSTCTASSPEGTPAGEAVISSR